jgi:hypothetical protein
LGKGEGRAWRSSSSLMLFACSYDAAIDFFNRGVIGEFFIYIKYCVLFLLSNYFTVKL